MIWYLSIHIVGLDVCELLVAFASTFSTESTLENAATWE